MNIGVLLSTEASFSVFPCFPLSSMDRLSRMWIHASIVVFSMKWASIISTGFIQCFTCFSSANTSAVGSTLLILNFYLSSLSTMTCLSVCLSVYLLLRVYRSVFLPWTGCLSVFPHLSVCPCNHHRTVCLSTIKCLSSCLKSPVCPSTITCLSVCPSNCLPSPACCLSVCLQTDRQTYTWTRTGLCEFISASYNTVGVKHLIPEWVRGPWIVFHWCVSKWHESLHHNEGNHIRS